MSNEPNAEEIIKAAQKRTRKPAAKPAVEVAPAPGRDSEPAVPVNKPEAAAEAVSGEPVDVDSPVTALERMGVAADAASEAVAAIRRMWG